MISIIVAYASGRVIGDNGKLPWRLPADLKHFKNITSGHTIVMGRKTFESIRRPLPQRRNLVLTHQHKIDVPGIEVVHSRAEVLALHEELFIIGGAEVYQEFLALADRLYITEVALEVAGDAFFPDWDRQAFTLTSVRVGTLDEKNILPHTFYTYDRKISVIS